MADLKIKPLTPEDKKALEEKKSAGSVWWLLIIICVVLGLTALILFTWEQPRFDTEVAIDHEIFGTFGDFVGGILGTIVAVFSVYFLVRTLRSQIESNAETVKSNRSVIDSNNRLLDLNNLQLYDSQFQSLYKQYLIAIDNYQEGDISGRKALENKVKNFLNKDFDNGLDYKRRSMAAVSEFNDFYAENRTVCSVHFRLLYLLFSLIAEANIDEGSRVMYAKSIRGQLSEGELAVLRYNCMTANGRKMQQFINQFNLLKHLPLMSIFEFRQLKSIIQKDELLSALDTTFIDLKKVMTNLNDFEDDRLLSHEISSRYSVLCAYENAHKDFRLVVNRLKKHKNGGGVKRPFEEKALDCLDEAGLIELFYAFLHETFITGSFGLYNDKDNCKVNSPDPLKNDKNVYSFCITVTKNSRLVLAERQVVPGT